MRVAAVMLAMRVTVVVLCDYSGEGGVVVDLGGRCMGREGRRRTMGLLCRLGGFATR